MGLAAVELGVAMGSGVDAVSNWADVSGDSVTADNLVIVQNWGVHPQARTDGNASATQEYLASTTTAGAVAALTTLNTNDLTNVGVALDTDAAYTRVTASDETGCAV